MSIAPASRLAPVLRWIGLTLVVLLGLQLLVLLTGWNWGEESYRQLFVQVLVSQSPMALVGLVLMLLSARLEAIEGRTALRITTGVVSILLALALLVAVPVSIGGDRSLVDQADQQLQAGSAQVEMMRSQLAAASPEALDQLVQQADQAGQLPAQANQQQKRELVKQLMSRQVKRAEDQLNQQRKARDLTVNQRRIGGTVSAVVLLVAFVLIALVALL
ncbi:MAG: HpsJ family protein [Cyanobacteriota bacterium]|nr:HpsJ family protein [Cyanobacteriota bacterium]